MPIRWEWEARPNLDHRCAPWRADQCTGHCSNPFHFIKLVAWYCSLFIFMFYILLQKCFAKCGPGSSSRSQLMWLMTSGWKDGKTYRHTNGQWPPWGCRKAFYIGLMFVPCRQIRHCEMDNIGTKVICFVSKDSTGAAFCFSWRTRRRWRTFYQK